MVEITVRRRRQLECPETDVVQSFVVNAECLVGVLDQLVHGQRCVVRLESRESTHLYLSCTSFYPTHLNDCVRDLRTGHDRVGSHHTIGVLLTDLRDEEGTHTSTGTTTERVGDLEA